MNFQWYPGHMTKAKRMMQEDIKLIDLVIELLDARIPLASRNPDIDTLANGKARLIILNKADLADAEKTEGWLEYFKNQGIQAIKINSKDRGSMKQIDEIVKICCAEKIERDRKKGIKNRPVRATSSGMPPSPTLTNFISQYRGFPSILER